MHKMLFKEKGSCCGRHINPASPPGLLLKGGGVRDRYPHGLLDVVLSDDLGRAVHVPLQTSDQFPAERQV